MIEQPPLFDASRTTPTVCPVGHCQAIRLPDQDRVATCACDRDRAHAGWTGPRPKHCLNHHDPAHAPFPEGY